MLNATFSVIFKHCDIDVDRPGWFLFLLFFLLLTHEIVLQSSRPKSQKLQQFFETLRMIQLFFFIKRPLLSYIQLHKIRVRSLPLMT